ncbi:MAG: hypothetical protein FWC89_10560 [Defluviitaleaceae bacterium]|nr:hypothetical protein [Defluviitaleaceae bacterium]
MQWYGGEAASVGFGMLVLALFCGGIFFYFVIGMKQGKVHAIISNEGIAVRENSFNIIPWGNITGVELNRGTKKVGQLGYRRSRKMARSGNKGVTIKYTDGLSNMQEVRFGTFFTNFVDEAEAIEAISKFRSNHYQTEERINSEQY